MKNLNKIGFMILVLVWPVSYYFKFIGPVIFNSQELQSLIVDYFITFGYCIGTSLIAFYYGKLEKNRITRFLFFYPISIFGASIVLAYLIDMLIDPIFGTKKVIITIIITVIASLCIYLFSRK